MRPRRPTAVSKPKETGGYVRQVEVSAPINVPLLREIIHDPTILDPGVKQLAAPTIQLSNLRNPKMAQGMFWGQLASLEWMSLELLDKPMQIDNPFLAEMLGFGALTKAIGGTLLNKVLSTQQMKERIMPSKKEEERKGLLSRLMFWR